MFYTLTLFTMVSFTYKNCFVFSQQCVFTCSRQDPRLKRHKDTIEQLSDEMREDYLLSVKKAIVDFVLNDGGPADPSDGAEMLAANVPEYKLEYVLEFIL